MLLKRFVLCYSVNIVESHGFLWDWLYFLIYLHCWLDFLFMDFQRKRLRIREVEMQKTFEFGNTEEGFETIAKIFFEQLTQELEKAYNDHIK